MGFEHWEVGFGKKVGWEMGLVPPLQDPLKNVHSQSLKINFGASDSYNSGGALIVSKDLNSLVSQLSNVGKQHEINSFQFAERRTLADILGFPHAANNGAV